MFSCDFFLTTISHNYVSLIEGSITSFQPDRHLIKPSGWLVVVNCVVGLH